MSISPVRVAVTGAAGQIGYSLVFRIASGHLLGPDQPVVLSLLEITPAMGALEGVAMELDDCAFPLLADLALGDDPDTAFDGVEVALLVGSRPRTKGMERQDLLEANGAIFTVQGRALNTMALAGLMKSWHMRAARKAAIWAVLVASSPAEASGVGGGAASLMGRETGVIWR